MTTKTLRSFEAITFWLWLLVTAITVLCIARPSFAAARINPELQRQLDAADPRKRIAVLVHMRALDGALAGLPRAPIDREARNRRLADLVATMKREAESAQRSPTVGHPRGILDQLGREPRAKVARLHSYWLTNAVAVDATPDVIQMLASRDDVDEIAFNGGRSLPPIPVAAPSRAWNLTRIGAVDAWDAGITGAGSLVAIVDTGVDMRQAGLAAKVLRDAAERPLWRDFISGKPAPDDDHGHGTHLTATVLGDAYGVAPGARWIACRAVSVSRQATTVDADAVLSCLQWLLNPDDPHPVDPRHVPDVVVLPWWIAGPGCDSAFRDAIAALRAAGVLSVVAAGDTGAEQSADRLHSPANYPDSFSVGSSDRQDAALADSAEGLASCGGGNARPAPRVLAPGLDILSAWKGTRPKSLTGTGPAAAHAAGAAALLWSYAPGLGVDDIDRILTASAAGAVAGPLPNHRTGRVDVLAALEWESASVVQVTPPNSPARTADLQGVTVVFRNDGATTWDPEEFRVVSLGSPESRDRSSGSSGGRATGRSGRGAVLGHHAAAARELSLPASPDARDAAGR